MTNELYSVTYLDELGRKSSVCIGANSETEAIELVTSHMAGITAISAGLVPHSTKGLTVRDGQWMDRKSAADYDWCMDADRVWGEPTRREQ